jgi:hypothetical protein
MPRNGPNLTVPPRLPGSILLRTLKVASGFQQGPDCEMVFGRSGIRGELADRLAQAMPYRGSPMARCLVEGIDFCCVSLSYKLVARRSELGEENYAGTIVRAC